MDKLSRLFHSSLELIPDIQNNVIKSLVIILVLWLLRSLINRIVVKKTEDLRTRYNWRKTTAYVAVFLGFILIGRVWFKGVQSLATFLGLLSAGLAIALKDLVSGLAGWIFILWRRPFAVGDRIQIGDNAGDVIDIRPFQFTVMEIGRWVDADQSTGRIIHVPNSSVLNQSLINYSKGFQYIWNEIPVLVTFESDWKKAKIILQSILDKHAEHPGEKAEKKLKEASTKFLIHYNVLTPTVYTSVKDSGVLLTLRYLTEPRKRRGSEQTVWEKILEEFGRCEDIDFAYPTQRFYNNILEGKKETKPALEPD
ncbi:MAG: mechanosensitive ion channel [Candidatus Glassbacteria bacterium]|nr:mechanosensitive ion channel [Candidatus Glassbacteria bacterium]